MQTVISVTAAAMICAVVMSFLRDGQAGQLLKLICAVVLTMAVLRPLARVDVGNFEMPDLPDGGSGREAARSGEEMARQTRARLIKEQTEAYILEKADDLGMTLQVEVEMGQWEPPVPIAVRLTGEAPDYLRRLLSQIIRQELGIEKEDQEWIS